MANGKTFIAELNGWSKQFPAKMDALARQVSQQVSENVIMATPVDTGFLRSSWQPSFDQPAAGQGVEGGQDKPLSMVSMQISSMKAGDVYYLTNNAEYAEHVEFGTSKMAGRFFVTDNVKRWPQVVAEVTKDLGMK